MFGITEFNKAPLEEVIPADIFGSGVNHLANNFLGDEINYITTEDLPLADCHLFSETVEQMKEKCAVSLETEDGTEFLFGSHEDIPFILHVGGPVEAFLTNHKGDELL